MKIEIVIFLGFCALYANAHPAIDGKSLLPHSVTELVSEIVTVVDEIKEKKDQVEDAARKIVEALIFEVAQLVSNTWTKVVIEIEKLRKGGKECVEKHLPGLNAAKETLNEEKIHCVKIMEKKGDEMRNNVEKDIELMRKSIDDFKLLAKECKNLSPVDAIKCVHEHRTEFEKYIENMINGVTAKISNFITKVTDTSTDTTLCIRESVLSFDNKQNKIRSMIKECISHRD